MQKGNFNYKKELKQLFVKASGSAAGAVPMEDREEVKQGGMADMYEGASKKQKRILKMQERMMKNKAIALKRMILVQPDPSWPRVDRLLGMEVVGSEQGLKKFSYVKYPEYDSLQKEFEAVQATNDIGMLINFLRKNFYHHESLVFLADFLRIQGKLADAFHCLERCLYAFECAWTYEF